ncbi:alpha/beta hydrolase [Aeromonas veronii]
MITIKSKISFYSQENKLIGYLYQPDNIVDNEVRSTILLVPPQAGVKEQTVDEYAQRLSAHGFICLTFDHATFGDSEGEPRFYENPYNKSEDISAAVTYLSTLDIVDKKSIFGLGICSGGGYLSHTAVTDRRISKVATVNVLRSSRFLSQLILSKEFR